MPHVTATLVNQPVWFDLSTSDLPAALRLYGELFGWTFRDSGPELGHYTMAFVGDQAAAAIAPKMPGGEGAPTAWTVYFGVTDADATAAAITAHGGRMLFEPMDIPGSGRMAVAMDPAGAAFGLWQAREFAGARIEGEHGAMCWCEVAAPDASAEVAFYSAVFGLDGRHMDDPRMTYYTLHQGTGSDAPAVAGVMQMDAAWEGIPPHWMPYFAVANLEAANEVFTRHGGEMLYGPIPSPYGRIMVVKDPQGAVLSYMAP